MNRAQAYGDGLFETMRVSGGRVLNPEEHYFRLLAGMRILRMPIPSHWNPDGWLADLKTAELDATRDYRFAPQRVAQWGIRLRSRNACVGRVGGDSRPN